MSYFVNAEKTKKMIIKKLEAAENGRMKLLFQNISNDIWNVMENIKNNAGSVTEEYVTCLSDAYLNMKKIRDTIEEAYEEIKSDTWELQQSQSLKPELPPEIR